MKTEIYEQIVKRTLLSEPDFNIIPKEVMISWDALGLAGEAGEVADLIKKAIYHQQGFDYEKLKKELGDVLWYLTAICLHTGIALSDVMELNEMKLRARYPNGYESKRTLVRDGMAE